MTVRLTLDVGDLDRYLIARSCAIANGDPARRRATRAQVRRFAVAALHAALSDRAAAARGRTRSVVRRLSTKTDGAAARAVPLLTPPDERQPTLW